MLLNLVLLAFYTFSALLFSFIMLQLPIFAVIFTLFIAVAFIFFADKSYQWTWFMYFKRYSVIFPIALYALLLWMIDKPPFFSIHIWLYFFIFVLFINTMEAGVLEILQAAKLNKINGVLIILFALLTPLDWTTKENIIGFENPIWVLGYTSVLSFMFINNPWFHEQKTSWLNISILLAALIAVFMHKNQWQYWMAYRAFTLYFLTLQLSFYKSSTQIFYKDSAAQISRCIPMKIVNYGWLAGNGALAVFASVSEAIQ